jgi:hypothetical protein
MIYQDMTGITWPTFTVGGGANPDAIETVVAAEALLLEQFVNAVGQTQAGESRGLCGLQIGGAGKGNQFHVTMMFEDTVGADQLFAVGTGEGLRAFCFQGQTVGALERSKELARGRALDFIAGHSDYTYRGFEISGSGDGMVYTGIFLVRRGELD